VQKTPRRQRQGKDSDQNPRDPKTPHRLTNTFGFDLNFTQTDSNRRRGL
jgi:hypothetical protein